MCVEHRLIISVTILMLLLKEISLSFVLSAPPFLCLAPFVELPPFGDYIIVMGNLIGSTMVVCVVE